MKKSGIIVFSLLILLSININAQSNNPPVAIAGDDVITTPGRITVLDASQSYDPDKDINDDSFIWYENEQQIGKGKILRVAYPKISRHFITLKVTDSSGLSSVDIVQIKVKEKETCKETKAVYFPDDT